MATSNTEKINVTEVKDAFENFAIEVTRLYGELNNLLEVVRGEIEPFGTDYVVPLIEAIEYLQSESESGSEYEICMKCSKIYESKDGYNEFYCSEKCSQSMGASTMVDKIVNIDERYKYESWKDGGC